MGQSNAGSAYQLPRSALIWQFVAMGVVVVPHLSYLPLWMPLALLLAMGWRLQVHMGRWSHPPHSVRALLSLCACGGVFLSFGGVGGVSGMVALLIAGFILKSLEIYQRRDALMVVYIAYLVAASALLFDQSIWLAAYILLSVQLVTAALIAIYQTHDPDDIGRPFRSSAVLMMQAVPLMLVLFILIPRIGPLWSLQLDLGGARTGLSEEMSPGDITRLTRSSDSAFRVQFEGEPPPRHLLYWRALTYPDFDGQRWYRDKQLDQRQPPFQSLEVGADRYRYQVMLEATGKTYAPVLDMPVEYPVSEYRLNQDLTLHRERPFNGRDQYQVASSARYQFARNRLAADYSRELRLPLSNPLAWQQAQQWYREAGSAEAYIQRLLSFFNQSFTYTLSPPRMTGNRIDQFLFESQRGFCGHFSSAMAFMLRAVGIPSRVVAGYQGGEWNPYEKYLLVRQYDAHAWVEAWLPGRGWVRFDPTAAVAPERIEQPADQLFEQQDAFLEDAPLGSLMLGKDSMLANLRLKWDSLAFGWQRWVVNYHRQQAGFLQDLLGGLTPWRLALALLLPFGVVMGAVALWLLVRGRNPAQDACDRALMRLSEKLEQKGGLGRSPGESIAAYCRRVAEIRPELEELLLQIAGMHEQMRYAEDSDPRLIPQLVKLIRHCTARV